MPTSHRIEHQPSRPRRLVGLASTGSAACGGAIGREAGSPAPGGAKTPPTGTGTGQLRARAWRIRGSTIVYRTSTAKFTRT